tara:strand:+ start:250 stop:537 length:288 start_codon:yes stop_codon:yes gene_type:complete
MQNLAEISLDLICTLKFAPPGGYETEDLAAMENACWQTLLHSLDPDEYAAILSAAREHLAELELESPDSLPEYLQRKRQALQELVANGEPDGDCA